MQYFYEIKDGDNAEVYRDYELFFNNSVEGIVLFAKGQTMATLSVWILNDTLLEGNETFHLCILRVTDGGREGTPSSLRVTILDGEQRKCKN